MGDDHGISTLVGDVIDRLLEVGQILSVKGGGQRVLGEALHQDVDAEGVHSLVDKSVNSGESGPDVVGVLDTRPLGLTEFRARLVDTKEFEGGGTLLFLLHRRSQRERCRTGDKNSGKTHGEG